MENGRATGVKLIDGSEIKARKLVVTDVDPYMLVIRFLRDAPIKPVIRRKVAALQCFRNTLDWYSWYLKERPKYIAGEENPDMNTGSTSFTALIDLDMERPVIEAAWRRMGRNPPNPTLFSWIHTSFDPKWAPPGTNYHTMLTEAYVAAADCYSDREWIEHKKEHADYVIDTLHQYAPNITWDSVLMYDACTPWDVAKRLKNMRRGSWSVVDLIPSQMGLRNRPIPELANYTVPEIKNLYCTDSPWGFSSLHVPFRAMPAIRLLPRI